jgi:hypothetical protein
MMTIEDIAGVADAMHALLVKRADELASSIDGAARRRTKPHHMLEVRSGLIPAVRRT